MQDDQVVLTPDSIASQAQEAKWDAEIVAILKAGAEAEGWGNYSRLGNC